MSESTSSLAEIGASGEAPVNLREAIDPQHTLPNVQLVTPEDYVPGKGISTAQIAIMHDGEQIGRAQIQRNSRDKEQNFSAINIAPEHRGAGYGMATYLAAIERAHSEGHAFRTHEISQTEAAKKVWDKFVATGLDEVVAVVPLALVEEDKKYTGHIRIELPNQS